MKLADGSVLSSNLGSDEPEDNMFAEMYSLSKMYIGQITEVLYVDNPKNHSKRYVEYNVLVNEKGITTSVFRNCRAFDSYGDQNNFLEKILQPITDGKRGKKDDSEPYLFKDGAMVVVGFLGGNKEAPVIIGYLQHPNLRLEKKVNSTPAFSQVGSTKSRDARVQELPTLLPGAKSAGDNDGQRILGEFNGLRWNINKDGELTVVFQGPKDSKGNLKNAGAQPTIIKVNKDGEVVLLDNLDQEIKISRKDKKIYISSGNTDPDFIEIDRTKKNITLDMSNDEIHNIDHDRVVTIKNDQREDITGFSDTNIGKDKKTAITRTRNDKIGKDHIEDIGGKKRVTVGGQQRYKSKGRATVQSDGATRIVGPSRIQLGGDSASEPLVLGTTWVAFYNLMIATQLNPLIVAVDSLKTTLAGMKSSYDTHTHGGVDTGGGSTLGPSASMPASTAVIPAAAPAASPLQLSDYVVTEKTPSGASDN